MSDDVSSFAELEPEIIHLSIEDQRQLLESILNPPEPNEAWKQAVERHRELFGEG